LLKSHSERQCERISIHRNSAALYYHKLHQLLASKMAEVEPEMGDIAQI